MGISIEIWNDVPNYIGIYQVSSFGRVKSFHRGVNILKPTLDSHGYYTVSLSCNGKKKNHKVSVLVAMSFLSFIPCGTLMVVDHIDNDRKNDFLKNIQIISTRKNTSKDRKAGLSKYVGVSFDKTDRRWKSEIWINGKSIYLGKYLSEIEAHEAYQNKLLLI